MKVKVHIVGTKPPEPFTFTRAKEKKTTKKRTSDGTEEGRVLKVGDFVTRHYDGLMHVVVGYEPDKKVRVKSVLKMSSPSFIISEYELNHK